MIVEVAHAHADDGAYADEAEQHDGEDRPVAKNEDVSGAVQRCKELTRLLAVQNGGLAFLPRHLAPRTTDAGLEGSTPERESHSSHCRMPLRCTFAVEGRRRSPSS